MQKWKYFSSFELYIWLVFLTVCLETKTVLKLYFPYGTRKSSCLQLWPWALMRNTGNTKRLVWLYMPLRHPHGWSSVNKSFCGVQTFCHPSEDLGTWEWDSADIMIQEKSIRYSLFSCPINEDSVPVCTETPLGYLQVYLVMALTLVLARQIKLWKLIFSAERVHMRRLRRAGKFRRIALLRWRQNE